GPFWHHGYSRRVQLRPRVFSASPSYRPTYEGTMTAVTAIGKTIVTGLLLASLASAEIQTQHVFDTSVKRGRLELLWHFRVRTKPEGGGLFQLRTGPIVEFDLNDRLTLITGYYFTREQNERQWTSINR